MRWTRRGKLYASILVTGLLIVATLLYAPIWRFQIYCTHTYEFFDGKLKTDFLGEFIRIYHHFRDEALPGSGLMVLLDGHPYMTWQDVSGSDLTLNAMNKAARGLVREKVRLGLSMNSAERAWHEFIQQPKYYRLPEYDERFCEMLKSVALKRPTRVLPLPDATRWESRQGAPVPSEPREPAAEYEAQ